MSGVHLAGGVSDRSDNGRHVTPTEWRAAMEEVDGPQLIVAGPGTGKTEFLVQRAALLIDRVLDRADRVLVLTFSRRAAADLRTRITQTLGRSSTGPAASTIHSFAFRLIETYHEGPTPRLLTGPEQVALVGRLLAAEDPRNWPASLRPMLHSPTFAGDVTDFLLRCAERGIDARELERLAAKRPAWRALPGFLRRYTEALEEENRLDYATLLSRAARLLNDDRILGEVAERHPYILVDEYQDLSPAQVRLLEMLASPTRNITAAGDPTQSVYSFRGARLENVDEFPHRFRRADGGPATRIVLSASFRVPATILEAARRILGPAEIPGAPIRTDPAPHEGTVEAYVFDQTTAEAEWIADEVERLHLAHGLPFHRMAVLVRSKRRFLNELSRALHRRNIPHDSTHQRLVDHPAVRLVFDVASAAIYNADHPTSEEFDQTMRRLLLGDLFRLSLAAERQLLRSRRRGTSWEDLLGGLGPEGRALAELIGSDHWVRRLAAVEGFWTFWEALPQIPRMIEDPGFSSHRAAWAAFSQALERQAERDPSVTLDDYWKMVTVEDFEATPLLTYSDPGDDRLTLTTLHQAKGLEFDVVFIADASDGLFPDLRRGVTVLDSHLLDGEPKRGGELSMQRLREEARLAYMAMTRARRRVVWTATAAGMEESERRPSRFLLLAAGVDSVHRLGPPRPHQGPPLTVRQALARLRRVLADPAEHPARRLAALEILARPGGGLWNPHRFAGMRRPGPDRGVLGEEVVLSPSQAEAYLNCPRNYVFERRLGIGDRNSPWARFGSLVHAVLEEAERRALGEGKPRSDLGAARAVLEEIWDHRADFGSEVLNRRWRSKAEALLEKLYAEWPSDTEATVAVEHRLELELEGRRWVGRADRIERTTDGRLRIVDYKTGTKLPTYAEVESSVQLGFYLLAAQADPELRTWGGPIEAELWAPRARGRWRRAFDRENLETVRSLLAETARRILQEDWTPRVGEVCSRCSVRLVCPCWPEGREGSST